MARIAWTQKRMTVSNTKENVGQEEHDAIWKTVFQSLPNYQAITLFDIDLHYLKNLSFLQILLICVCTTLYRIAKAWR